MSSSSSSPREISFAEAIETGLSQPPTFTEAIQPSEQEQRRRETLRPRRSRTHEEAFAPQTRHQRLREIEDNRNLALYNVMNAVARAFHTLEAPPPPPVFETQQPEPPPVVLSHEIRRNQTTPEEDNDVAAPGCTKFPTKEQANQDIEMEETEKDTEVTSVVACVVCLINKACCVADPCGHCHTCATCSRTICKAKKKGLVHCPTCRNKVEKFMKVYC